MEIEIVRVFGHGDAGDEQVFMRVVAGCNVGKYMLADTTYVSPDRVSNELRHVYWFPDGRVDPGDTIVLSTGRGSNDAEVNTDGTMTHYYFWGLERPVWNDTGDYAVLIKVEDWFARSAL